MVNLEPIGAKSYALGISMFSLLVTQYLLYDIGTIRYPHQGSDWHEEPCLYLFQYRFI